MTIVYNKSTETHLQALAGHHKLMKRHDRERNVSHEREESRNGKSARG